MSAQYEIKPNPDARVQLRRFGREGHGLLVIDDLVLQPESLIDQAAETAFEAPESSFYPGLNAALPRTYIETLLPVLKPSLGRAFGIDLNRPMAATGFFALATHETGRLSPLQKIPHYDQPDPHCLAMVHYMSRVPLGGTGFFRHLATGYEAIDLSRRDLYRQKIDAELPEIEPRLTDYPGRDTPNFEMIEAIDARFNRAIIYRSNLLHCALLQDVALSSDPCRGRLTINSFFRAQT